MNLLELKQLRVLFIAGTLGQGGAERQLFYTLKVMRDAGINLRLLCLTQGEYWEKPIRDLGVPINWLDKAKNRLARARGIIQICRTWQPQIIQSQHFYMNFYAALAARLTGAKEIGAIRSSGYHEMRNTGKILGWISLHAPRLIAANSRKAADFAVQQGRSPQSVFFLPNFIDDTQFNRNKTAAHEVLRLLTVGRLETPKRYDRLLQLIARFRDCTTKPFRLTIAGDGSLRASLQQQAQTLGLLPNYVKFCGAIDDTASLYQEADIFLLSSDYEGTPNVVMEAMATSLPIISTNIGGVSEILEHNVTGLFFDPSDEAGYLTALLDLSDNPLKQKSLGHAARHYIELNHSLAQLIPTYANLYERALQ